MNREVANVAKANKFTASFAVLPHSTEWLVELPNVDCAAGHRRFVHLLGSVGIVGFALAALWAGAPRGNLFPKGPYGPAKTVVIVALGLGFAVVVARTRRLRPSEISAPDADRGKNDHVRIDARGAGTLGSGLNADGLSMMRGWARRTRV